MAFGGVALPGSGSSANNAPTATAKGSANGALTKVNGAGDDDKKVANAGKDASLEQGLSSVHGIVPTLQ